jgi:hypothetical protein
LKHPDIPEPTTDLRRQLQSAVGNTFALERRREGGVVVFSMAEPSSAVIR